MNKFKEILSNIPNLKNCEVLDIFAREGDWQSYILNNNSKSIEAWEIEKSFIPNLKKNLPNAYVLCHDSISFINNIKNYKKFDLIIIDNGLNCYGENYCEHFDFLHNIPNFLKPEGYIIFNVVTQPFNYKNNKNWQSRRNKFYGLKDCSILSKKFIKNFYTKFFSNLGLDTTQYNTLCREYYNDIDYLYYIGMKLKK